MSHRILLFIVFLVCGLIDTLFFGVIAYKLKRRQIGLGGLSVMLLPSLSGALTSFGYLCYPYHNGQQVALALFYPLLFTCFAPQLWREEQRRRPTPPPGAPVEQQGQPQQGAKDSV